MVVKKYCSDSHNLVLPSSDEQQKLLLLPGTINPYRNSLPSVYTASLQRLLLFNLRLFPCFCLLFLMQTIEIEMEPLNFAIKIHKNKQNSYTLNGSRSFRPKSCKIIIRLLAVKDQRTFFFIVTTQRSSDHTNTCIHIHNFTYIGPCIVI